MWKNAAIRHIFHGEANDLVGSIDKLQKNTIIDIYHLPNSLIEHDKQCPSIHFYLFIINFIYSREIIDLIIILILCSALLLMDLRNDLE